MLRSILFACCFIAVLAPWARPAAAQDTVVRAGAEQDAEARRIFEAGRTAFESSMFEVALSCFQRSFELSGRPTLLYNIGIVSQRLGRVDEALAAFERFVREAPDDPGRADVDARIEVLRDVRPRTATAPSTSDAARAPDRVAPNEPDARPARDPRRAARARSRSVVRRESARLERDRRSRGGLSTGGDSAGAWPWVTAAAGTLVAASGVVLLVSAGADAAAVEDASDGTRWVDVADRADRASGLFIAGEIALGVGIAAIGAGLGWWIVRSTGESSQSPNVRLSATGLAGTF